MVQSIEQKRAQQRTEEYKIKKRIRDKKYREANLEKIKERYKKLHPNLKPRIKIYAHKKEQKKAQKKRNYQKNSEFLLNFKKDKCCISCGYKQHPEILQFHHTEDKLENISKLKKKSLGRIKTEIEKCILLCPNCHFLLHFNKSKGDVDFINLVLIDEAKRRK